MILTFIGMSGAGKTFWASQLAAHGFTCFDCDSLLAAKLRLSAGHVGTSLLDIGRWMGFPYEDDFRQREALYLACEADTLRDVIARAMLCAATRTNCVIDTGGSAIYANAELFQQIQGFSTVVYLAIPAAIHRQMVLAYLDNPRPLIWNGLFEQTHHENLQDTFIRCYAQLIKYREALYELYSDVALEYSFHRQPTLTPATLLQYIRAAAEHATLEKR